jgi:heme-degrading monooxygenase HmoA
MVCEVVILDVKPGEEGNLESGVAAALPLFKRAKGCMSLRLLRSEQIATRYWLLIEWETLEDHTVHFRQSADHAQWHRLVRHLLASPPAVDDARTVLPGFARAALS